MPRLADIRKRRYMSVLELAKAAKVGHTTIQRIEAGQVTPHLRTRRQIAAALGIAPDGIDWPEVTSAATDEGH